MFDFYAFLRKKWTEHSSATGQKGTVVDELAVKPTGLVMSDFNNSLVEQRRVNNISEWRNMTDDELDFFGNKFFFPRINGDYTFGNVRIWFDEKKDITISQNSRFNSEDGYKYRAIQPGMISKSSFKMSTDHFALFYVDVPIIAESKGNQFNVNVGQITNISDIEFTYKMVSNPDDMQNGSKYETNEEYYNRIVQSINDRSMMNKRSMFVRIPEFFPVVSSMYIAASGDKYMKRDLVSGIDVSRPIQRVDYLGKITGENIIKNIAFYGIFPPNVGSLQKEAWGPFSVLTKYDTPLTISPTDLTASIAPPQRDAILDPTGSTIFSGQSGDPGLHGFPLDQEMTIDQYKGMYFDDYKTFTEIETSDLWNILDENIGNTPLIVPDSTWVYGAHGKTSGDLGEMYGTVEDIDILNFQNNEIKLSGGFKSNSITVSKDIDKRIGIKITGTFTFPEVVTDGVYPDHSNLQIMVGGQDGSTVEGYTGIGFGVRLNGVFNASNIYKTNAILYFAHSEQYGTAQVFATDFDYADHISITDLGALAEKPWRIQGGEAYDFEFVIKDDLRVTLYLNRQIPRVGVTDSTNLENKFYFQLDKTVLNIYSSELFNKNTDHYGTMAKITLEADSETATDIWQIDDIKFVDLQHSRALSLLAMNMTDIESPVELSIRAFGNGSVNNTQSEGYSLFIWDKEISTIGSGSEELTSGGWSKLDDVSNPTGSKDVLTNLLSKTIDNLDRYLINSRYGTNVFIMVAATGTSQASSLFFGDLNDDIKSRLRIDYIKIDSQSMSLYHTNNKSDMYVSTIKNSEEIGTTSILLSKSSNDSFFVMNTDAEVKMPVESIKSVTIGAVTSDNDPLSDTEYTIVRPNDLLSNSSREEIRLYLNGSDSNDITVEYTTYPEVSRMQDFFDGTEFGKIYGDILVKHKLPIILNFTVFFTGDINDDQLVDEIRKYVDDNIDGVFSTRKLVSYLYNNSFVNNIQEPIEVSYSRYDNDGRIVAGTFTDTITAKDTEFFRIDDLSVSRL